MQPETTKTASPIPFTAPPEYCGACLNCVLDNAGANPQQKLVNVYCEHGRSLITAQIADLDDGQRAIYCWSISGPMSQEQAIHALHASAQGIGATPVFDYGWRC